MSAYFEQGRDPLPDCAAEDEAEHIWRWFGWGPGKERSRFRDAMLNGRLCKAAPPLPTPKKYYGVQCCRFRGHEGVHIGGKVGSKEFGLRVVAKWADVT